MADEIPEADVEAAGRTYENDDDRHSELDAHQAAEDAHRQDRDTTPYVSHCVVCGKSGGQHPDGRWCGSEQYVTGDWTDIPIVNDVARAIGGAFHRGDDAWTTEALAAIAAARPHLTAAKDAEITRLRQYAAATKYHQDQHATAVRELEPLKATVAEALALLERFDTPGDRRRVEGLLSDLRHVLTDKSSPSAPAQEGQTT